MPFVQHPSFANDIRQVPEDKLKEFEEMGWVRVKKGQEPDPHDVVPPAEIVPQQ